MPGDVLHLLDGISVDDLVAQWRPIYADSNEAARLREIGWYMTRGACGDAAVVVQRGDASLSLTSRRVPSGTLDYGKTYVHDLPGDAFQKLSDDVAYLKLSSVVAA